MNGKEFLLLAVSHKVITVQKGHVLCDKGAKADKFFALVGGKVTADNSETGAIAAPATLCLPDMASGAYVATVVATSQARLIELGAEDISDFIRLCPNQALEVFEMQFAGIIPKKAPEPTPNAQPEVMQEPAGDTQKQDLAKQYWGMPKNARLYGDAVTVVNDCQYLHESEHTCPVCKNKFSAKNVLYSRLRTESYMLDMRVIYKDFDPLWFNIMSCNQCGYTNQQKDFAEITGRQAQRLAEYLSQPPWTAIAPIFQANRDIDSILLAHYAAYHINKQLPDNELTCAKLLLNTLWLYEDVQDTEQAHIVATQALKEYEYINEKTSIVSSPEAEQQLFMILAELYIRLKNKDAALRMLSDAIRCDSNNRVYKERCRRRFEDIKEGVVTF